MNKKKIIIFSGNFNNIFLSKELNYLNEKFSEIVIFSNEKLNDFSDSGIDYKFYQISYLKLLRPRFLIEFLRRETIIEIIKASKDKKFQLFPIRLFYIIFYIIHYFSSKDKILREIQNSKDVILYSYWLSKGAYIFSRFKSTNNVRKIVSRAHGYDLYQERNISRYIPFRSYINSSLNTILFISDSGRQYYSNYFNHPNLIVSKLGVIFDKYIDFQMINQPIVFFSISNIIKVKRIDRIINVLSSLKHDIFWYHLGDGPLKTKMETYAKSKFSKNNFCFLGFKNNEEVMRYLKEKKAHFIINLSDSEGIPVSIMESMSLGVQGIARDVGGTSELVNSSNGILLSSLHNDVEITNIIDLELDKYLSNRDRFIQKCVMAQKTIDFNFNEKINYKDLTKYLDS